MEIVHWCRRTKQLPNIAAMKFSWFVARCPLHTNEIIKYIKTEQYVLYTIFLEFHHEYFPGCYMTGYVYKGH